MNDGTCWAIGNMISSIGTNISLAMPPRNTPTRIETKEIRSCSTRIMRRMPENGMPIARRTPNCIVLDRIEMTQ